MSKSLILMGSPADKEWCKKIADELNKFGIECEMRVASAHKVPEHTLNIIRSSNCDIIITVAGRSNALSGLTDGSTTKPVIACPPLDGQNILYDIYSTIRMPSGIAPLLVLTPENAALASAKIIGIKDENVRKRVEEYQKAQQKKLFDADKELSNG
ncbi:MAG: AIR carboxylase family protein [Deltaproteobacteria bacterium]|nr:AIR carboxylase family protein [Deltaproteobacteria bacterium]